MPTGKSGWWAGSLALVLVVVVGGLAASTSVRASKQADLVKRGEYLVSFAGCHDCHSPKVMTEQGPAPDPKRLLSGFPADTQLPPFDRKLVAPGGWVLFNEDLTACVGPWGITYAFNLTPDDQTGIGLWTEDVFIAAMRTGKHMGAGRPILPPMPWQYVGKLTDDDLRAVFAYLESLPPIKNPVPAPVAF